MVREVFVLKGTTYRYDERSALIYVILNRGEGGGLTVNLQGPLVFNPVSRLGRQLVLTSSRYAVRYPLDHQAFAIIGRISLAGRSGFVP